MFLSTSLYSKMCWMLLCQDPRVCKGEHCFEAEPVPCTSKTSRTAADTLGNSYSVMYSRKLQGHETSKYILLFTAQTILLKEARLACALLLGLGWHKEFSLLSERFRGKGALLGIHLSSVPLKLVLLQKSVSL